MNEKLDTALTESNRFTTAVNVLTAPRDAFGAIKQRPRWAAPLLLLFAGTGLTTFLYLNGVDLAWFFIEQMSASGQQVSEAQLDQMSEFFSNLPQVAVASALAGIGLISLTVVLVVQALYFKLVSLIAKDGLLYKQCFGLICWASLPSVFSYLASAITLLTSDVDMMPQYRVNPLTFVNLLGLEPPGAGALDQYVTNLDPMTVWSILLVMLGYRTFTARSLAASATIAIAPYALIIGIGVAF